MEMAMEGIIMVRVGQRVRVTIPDHLVKQVKAWQSENNLGQRSFCNGSDNQQLAGILGEVAVHRYLYGEWPDISARSCAFDNGIDLQYGGFKIDVKTFKRCGYVDCHYTNRVYRHQTGDKYQNDAYIFCSYNYFMKTVEICGWTTKEYLLKEGAFSKRGTRQLRDDGEYMPVRYDNYEIPNSDLLDILLLKELYT